MLETYHGAPRLWLDGACSEDGAKLMDKHVGRVGLGGPRRARSVELGIKLRGEGSGPGRGQRGRESGGEWVEQGRRGGKGEPRLPYPLAGASLARWLGGSPAPVITHKYRGSQQFSRVEYSTQIYRFDTRGAKEYLKVLEAELSICHAQYVVLS